MNGLNNALQRRLLSDSEQNDSADAKKKDGTVCLSFVSECLISLFNLFLLRVTNIGKGRSDNSCNILIY